MANKPPPPYDKGWAWVVVFGVFVNMFFIMGITKSCGIFMVDFIDRFDVSTTSAGTAIMVGSLIFAFCSPIAGALGDSITHRKLVMVGGIIGMVGYSLCTFLVSMPYVIVLYSIAFGIGNSCSYGSCMVMIGKYFRKNRSFATGIALSGASVGQFVMPPVIEYLKESYGLGGTLLIVGALYLHCTFAGSLFRPIEQYAVEGYEEDLLKAQIASMIEDEANDNKIEPVSSSKLCDNQFHEREALCPNSNGIKEESNKQKLQGDSLDVPALASPRKLELSKAIGLTNSVSSLCYTSSMLSLNRKKGDPVDGDVDDSDKTATTQKTTTTFFSLLKHIIDFNVLRNYVVIYYAVICFFCYYTLYNFVIFSPAIVVSRGMSKYDKALLISFCGLGDLVGRLSFGMIADRNFLQRYHLQASTCLIGGLNLLVFMFADSFGWMATHCFIYGFTAGGFVCMMPVVMLDFIGLEILSKALGIAVFTQGLAGGIGQPLMSVLLDETSSQIVILILALTSFISGTLLMFMPCIHKLEKKRQALIQNNENGNKLEL